MPMIEFRYRREKISDCKARAIGSCLEQALRDSIRSIRPEKGPYNITVEGDPFGPIIHNQPDLRIYVFYHQGWNFTSDELPKLADQMAAGVEPVLARLGLEEARMKIRIYARYGDASATLPRV